MYIRTQDISGVGNNKWSEFGENMIGHVTIGVCTDVVVVETARVEDDPKSRKRQLFVEVKEDAIRLIFPIKLVHTLDNRFDCQKRTLYRMESNVYCNGRDSRCWKQYTFLTM